MPRRTLSPRISTTVTVISLLITILSFFFLDSTSIAAYPSLRPGADRELIPTRSGGRRTAAVERAGEEPLPLQEPGVRPDRHPLSARSLSVSGTAIVPFRDYIIIYSITQFGFRQGAKSLFLVIFFAFGMRLDL